MKMTSVRERLRLCRNIINGVATQTSMSRESEATSAQACEQEQQKVIGTDRITGPRPCACLFRKSMCESDSRRTMHITYACCAMRMCVETLQRCLCGVEI